MNGWPRMYELLHAWMNNLETNENRYEKICNCERINVSWGMEMNRSKTSINFGSSKSV